MGHALIATTIKNRVSNIRFLRQRYHPDPWVYCSTIGYHLPQRFAITEVPTGEEPMGVDTPFKRAIDGLRNYSTTTRT